MRKIVLVLICTLLFICFRQERATAQSLAQLAVQLGLNIEKLNQLRGILSSMKSGYEIISKGYGTVKDITQGNFSIHQTFLDGLMQVSPEVKRYYKVAEIINYQLILIQEYKAAYKRFRGHGTFNAGELQYLSTVYGNLFEESLQNLDELLTVTTAGKLRMSDDERLNSIDRIHGQMQDKLTFLRAFNHETGLLSLLRAKEHTELETMAEFHGVK